MAGVERAFRAPGGGLSQSSSAADAQLDLAAILCHVEQRVIGNDYTFSFAGRRYQIATRGRASRHAAAALARGTAAGWGVEGALSGPLPGRSQSAACGRGSESAAGRTRPVRKDHNAGGQQFTGWRASSIVPARRCGKLHRQTESQFGIAGTSGPAIFAFKPKASAREFHQKQSVVVQRKALFGDRLRPPGL